MIIPRDEIENDIYCMCKNRGGSDLNNFAMNDSHQGHVLNASDPDAEVIWLYISLWSPWVRDMILLPTYRYRHHR